MNSDRKHPIDSSQYNESEQQAESKSNTQAKLQNFLLRNQHLNNNGGQSERTPATSLIGLKSPTILQTVESNEAGPTLQTIQSEYYQPSCPADD